MIDSTPVLTSVSSPGALLRKTRLKQKLSLADVANKLLLTVDQVEALENGDHKMLPGPTYIIGYWRNYANVMGIDANAEIESHKHSLGESESTIILERNHQQAHGHQEKSRKKSALLFCFFSLIFLTGIWYWQNPEDNPVSQWTENQASHQISNLNANSQDTTSTSNNTEPDVMTSLPKINEESSSTLPQPNFSDEIEDGESSQIVEINVAKQPEEESDQLVNANDTDGTEFADENLNVQDSLPVVVSSEQEESTGSETDSEETSESIANAAEFLTSADSAEWIGFTISKETWLEVRDREGEKLIYRTVDPGEHLNIKGSPPFYVFIGGIDGVEVQYLGEVVAYEPHKNGLFTRFKIGEAQ